MKDLLYKLGTVVFAAILLPFLFVGLFLLALDEEKQERINREHGEGEV